MLFSGRISKHESPNPASLICNALLPVRLLRPFAAENDDCPSVKFASVANAIGRGTDVFNGLSVLINMIG